MMFASTLVEYLSIQVQILCNNIALHMCEYISDLETADIMEIYIQGEQYIL